MTSPRSSRKACVAGAPSQGRAHRRPCQSGAVWTAGLREAGRGFAAGERQVFQGKDTSLGSQPIMSQPIKKFWGAFPGGPWLGLSAVTAEARVGSLIRELRSHGGEKRSQLLGMIWPNSVFKGNLGDFLVAQWLRICLPIEGTQFRSLVRRLRFHSLPGSSAHSPRLPSQQATATDALVPRTPAAVKEAPAVRSLHRSRQQPPRAETRESPGVQQRRPSSAKMGALGESGH